MKNEVLWGSSKSDWETPQDFYDELNREFCEDLQNYQKCMICKSLCDKYDRR